MCHAHGDCQEALAVSLLLRSPPRGTGTLPIELSPGEITTRSTDRKKNNIPQDKRMIGEVMLLTLVLPTTSLRKLPGVRHKESLQVDQRACSGRLLLTFAAQSGS